MQSARESHVLSNGIHLKRPHSIICMAQIEMIIFSKPADEMIVQTTSLKILGSETQILDGMREGAGTKMNEGACRKILFILKKFCGLTISDFLIALLIKHTTSNM